MGLDRKRILLRPMYRTHHFHRPIVFANISIESIFAKYHFWVFLYVEIRNPIYWELVFWNTETNFILLDYQLSGFLCFVKPLPCKRCRSSLDKSEQFRYLRQSKISCNYMISISSNTWCNSYRIIQLHIWPQI